MKRFIGFLALTLIWGGASAALAAEKIKVRIGHFPNITHVQALVAHALSRQGKGWFEARLGPTVEIQWFVYNAGPSAIEAIFANSIDVTYIGPNPALNAYVKSNGAEARILSGAVNGGAALVVQDDGRIKSPQDFKGRKIATPQLGNTQDVAARAWLKRQGFKITQLGGDVLVVPSENADQLSMFSQGNVDAVWTVEPWVSRLELQAKGKIFMEQKDTVTTVLLSSARFVKDRPELAQKLKEAHRELTGWINANPQQAKALVRLEMEAATRRAFPAELLERSWPRLQITNEVSRASLDQFVADAVDAGFLKAKIDLDRLLTEVK